MTVGSAASRACLVFGVLSGVFRVVAAQPKPAETFDDLARRAEGTVDSRPAEAASLYKQALALRPDWTEGWFYLGASLYQLDRYAEATDAFRKVVAQAPAHGTAWAFLGLCETELDNADQALADIRKGEELGLGGNPEFEIAVRVRAAKLLVEISAFDEAVLELQPLARLNADSPAVLDTMGMCALAIPGKLSDIATERRAVVSLAGKAAWALASQRPAEATEAYKNLVARYPDAAGVRYAHALYLIETDAASALTELRKEADNNPSHWPSLMLIATLKLRQGITEDSMLTIRRAMKIVPPNFRWLCHAELGRANLTVDNLDGAITELKTAARLKPASAQIRFLLAQAYRRAGRAEDARTETAEFQRLKLQQDPFALPALSRLGNR